VYGDPAYHQSEGIIAPFRTEGSDASMRRFNERMTRARIAVEQGFGKITNLWRANQYAAGQQSRNQPVGAYYLIATLLTNIYTCCRQEESPFGLLPPSVEEYLEPAGKPPLPFPNLVATDR
jgi:hypothetical protein